MKMEARAATPLRKRGKIRSCMHLLLPTSGGFKLALIGLLAARSGAKCCFEKNEARRNEVTMN
jgi:hypothetical protein